MSRLIVFSLGLLIYTALAGLQPIDFSAASSVHNDELLQRGFKKLFSLIAGKNDSDPFLGVQYHSGYIRVGNKLGEMFYWYFPHESGTGKMTSEDTPFVVWLTGGPGCSSELAILYENGPLLIQPDGTLARNEYSWSTVADIVYVDQPLGTGFSIIGDATNYVTDEKTVAADMRQFFVQFIDQYPHLKNRPFFLTGESYAGHYIPSIAHFLLRSPVDGLDFRGIAIGNGWVDPRSQYPAYAEYAFEHGMVSPVVYRIAKEAFKGCVQAIDDGLWYFALIECNSIVVGLLGERNPYDVRLNCELPPMCYDTSPLDSFMNRPDVQRSLGVHKKWRECSSLVYSLLLGDWISEMRTKVGEILEAGKQVLVYSGDQDFICNWRGGEAWVGNIEWGKADEFRSQTYTPWFINGDAVGAMKHVGNLTFLRVYNAGHMAPMDQPRASLSMIESFLDNNFNPRQSDDFAVARLDINLQDESGYRSFVVVS